MRYVLSGRAQAFLQSKAGRLCKDGCFTLTIWFCYHSSCCAEIGLSSSATCTPTVCEWVMSQFFPILFPDWQLFFLYVYQRKTACHSGSGIPPHLYCILPLFAHAALQHRLRLPTPAACTRVVQSDFPIPPTYHNQHFSAALPMQNPPDIPAASPSPSGWFSNRVS